MTVEERCSAVSIVYAECVPWAIKVSQGASAAIFMISSMPDT